MVSSMTSYSPSPLLDAFEHQDKIFSSAFSILREAIAQRKIPSSSVAITHSGRLIAEKALGHFTYEDHIESTTSDRAAPLLASFSRRAAAHPTSSTLSALPSLTKLVA